MDKRLIILEVKCSEPDGEVVRTVRLCELTVDKLGHFYEKLRKFEVLFNDHIGNSFEGFLNMFLQEDSAGNPQPKGIIYEVDDVGIIYITEIKPGIEALAHFTFWDRRIKGREELLRQMLRYGFEKFGFHRIRTEVGLMALPAIAGVERIGFIREGRLREATMYKGSWFDVNIYSVLEHEVENLGKPKHHGPKHYGKQSRKHPKGERRHTARG